MFFAVSVIALFPAIVWLLDAKHLPEYAVAWVVIGAGVAAALGAITWSIRKFIRRTGFIVSASLVAGAVIGLGLPLLYTYRNSCTAIGWRYDKRGDIQLPWIVWSDGWGCYKVGKFQHFAGIWTFGERTSDFTPVPPNPATPPGRLSIDEAARNLVFDTMLHRRLGRDRAEVYIEFYGNPLIQGRSDSAHSTVLYQARDIKTARLIRSGEPPR